MDMKMMENFIVTAECENVTKAAEKLNISQPPLTRQIRSLEEELGVELFIREKKRVHITEEGKFVKKQFEQILELYEKTKEQAREMQSGIGGTLFLGCAEALAIVYLPKWIEDFKKLYPNVKYDLWSANSDAVIEQLESGLRDIALIRNPYSQEKFDGISIVKEPWNVIISKDNPLSKKKGRITYEVLSREQLIVPSMRKEQVSEWFEKRGFKADIICEFSPLMNGVILAGQNIGIAICPACAIKIIENQNVVMKELEKPVEYSGASLIWRKNEKLSHSANKFIEFIREQAVQ